MGYALPFPLTERREVYVLVEFDAPLATGENGAPCSLGRWVVVSPSGGGAVERFVKGGHSLIEAALDFMARTTEWFAAPAQAQDLGAPQTQALAFAANPAGAASAIPVRYSGQGAGAATSPSPWEAAAGPLCAALAAAVDAQPGAGPAFVQNYLPSGEDRPPQPVSAAAFTYDNALAVIALYGCGLPERAARPAEALRLAAAYGDRVLNAYSPGPAEGAPLSPGWWDSKADQWFEDGYQVGSATGNVACAALALLHAHAETGEARYREAAVRAMAWIGGALPEGPARPGGYPGGVIGFEPAPEAQLWTSTEHNIDIAAAARWLSATASDEEEAGRWRAMAERAAAFVAAMRLADGGLRTGAGPDGGFDAPRPEMLDAQLWPSLAGLLPKGPPITRISTPPRRRSG